MASIFDHEKFLFIGSTLLSAYVAGTYSNHSILRLKQQNSDERKTKRTPKTNYFFKATSAHTHASQSPPSCSRATT